METNKKSNSWVWIVVVFLVVFLCCCCCAVAVFGVSGVSYFLIDNFEETLLPEIMPELNLGPVEINRQPVSEGALETAETLQEALVPSNDLRDLAERLTGKTNIPLTMEGLPAAYEVGDVETFWATNVDSNENFQIDARLAYITDHSYFWIEEDVSYDESDLKELADTFEKQIYPVDREFFGSEWLPGIDNDPRVYVIYASGLGSGLAGYFSSVDSVHPDAHEYSNAHETFYFNADTVNFDEEFTYGVLAHEFQHMIHWYHDKNEETWLNEGFSELASLLNGYDPGGFDTLFALYPDIQLNYWPDNSTATSSHYGASFLFVSYFLDRFGEDVTKAVVAHPENGLESLDIVFDEMDVRDESTDEVMTADEFFRDWTLTNYLADDDIADGRFNYQEYQNAPKFRPNETISDCNGEWISENVSQYGADYFRIMCNEPVLLSFEGSTEVELVPMDAYSGDYMFWSNKGDESDMTLTRKFDFRSVIGELDLDYWIWYDLELDFDYLYLLASEDGESWEIIQTPSGTDADPSGNSYGWGYNGQTGNWMKETVDLSKFAGKEVFLRFEYVTDAAVNGEGLLLDDVRIDAINYEADFEENDGGWTAEGFVRIQNRLPQTYLATLILKGQDTQIKEIKINADQSFNINLNFSDYDEVILVVSGTTRFTWSSSGYQFKLEPAAFGQ